jgi:hypothetical protein
VRLFDAFAIGWIVTALVYGAVGHVLVLRVRARLRSRHPETLAELGPLYAWNPLRVWFHRLEWHRFLVWGGYLRLEDEELDRLCRPAQWWLGLGFLALIGLGALLVVVAALRSAG